MLKIFPLISIIFLLFCNNLNAQTDDTEDNNASFFDDGNVAARKNILKLNLISTLHGDLSVQYERVLNKKFSIEVGAGRILSYYIPELHVLLDSDNLKIEDPNGNYSLWLQPKYYLQQKAPQSYYMGIQLRRRYYDVGSENEMFTHNDLLLTTGMQVILIKQRLVIDYNAGYGLRVRNLKNPPQFADKNQFEFLYHIGLKLGYSF